MMLSWIKRKIQSFKDKWNRDWQLLTVSRFKNFLENLGGVSIVILGVILISVLVGGLINTFIVSLPVVTTWLFFTVVHIFLPFLVILGGCIIGTNHIEKWYRQNDYGVTTKWWTQRKAEKLRRWVMTAAITFLVIQLLSLLLMSVHLWGAYVFIPSALPTVIGLKLLYEGVFMMACNIIGPVLAWSTYGIIRFEYSLQRQEMLRLHERRGRDSGCMSDFADEDDILDCRLERLGI